ncbi:MAG: hypothetical protein ACI9SE_002044 [Neolewinella sp.]|jgi:hypothetical protein
MSAVRDEVPEEARYEVKYAAREVEVNRVLNWLLLHPAGFRVAHPDRQINNVYFDTHDYAALDEKLAGTSSRNKLRYRWYGEQLLPAAGTLELKCRRNAFGWKLNHYVTTAPQSTATWPSFIRELRLGATPVMRRWLDENPVVVMINRYQRRYFESADGRVRATIDTGLATWDQRFGPRPNVDRPAPLARSVVLELKFGRHDRDFAAACMRNVPIRVSAHSKYALAVEAIGAT